MELWNWGCKYHDEVITQLPTSNNALLSLSVALDHSLIKMLTEMRGNNSNTSKAAPKQRLAGKSYSVSDEKKSEYSS